MAQCCVCGKMFEGASPVNPACDTCIEQARRRLGSEAFNAWKMAHDFADPKTPVATSGHGAVWGLAFAGILIGGFIGFLLRPAFLGYQMPFKHVITRGANLGDEKMLAPLAQTSFNYMLAGSIGGAIVGSLIGFLISTPTQKT